MLNKDLKKMETIEPQLNFTDNMSEYKSLHNNSMTPPNSAHIAWNQIFLWIQAIAALWIITANSIVLSAFIKNRKLRTTNALLFNQTIVDLMVGLSLPVHLGVMFLTEDCLTTLICELKFALRLAPLYTSSLSLVMITIERFLAVLFPFKLIFWMTPKIKALLIATAWSLPFILTFLLPILSWENEIKGEDCDFINFIPPWYMRGILIPISFLPCLALIVFYIKILQVARQQINSIHLLVIQVSKDDQARLRNYRLARTGFIILGVFLLCWLPSGTLFVIRDLTRTDKDFEMLCLLASILPLIVSALNPIIYASRIHRMKVQLKRMFCQNINSEDVIDKYEIRQSFLVKRSDALTAFTFADTSDEHSDSGFGGNQNEAFISDELSDEDVDEVDEEIKPELRIFENLRKMRALSRISESPESHCEMVSPAADKHNKTFTETIQSGDTDFTDTILNALYCEDNQSLSSVKNKVSLQRSYNTLRKTPVLDSRTKHNQSPGSTLENTKKKPLGRTQSNAELSPVISEPITIDCDGDSEYFKVVVKRVVCCDSDYDNEQATQPEEPKQRKQSKKFKRKEKPETRGQEPETSSPQNSVRPPVAQPTPRLHRPVNHTKSASHHMHRSSMKVGKGHKRTTSTCSAASLVFNNDEIHIEVSSDTSTKQKRQSSRKRTTSKTHESFDSIISQESFESEEFHENLNHKSNGAGNTSIKGFFQGTFERMKRMKRPKIQIDMADDTQDLEAEANHNTHQNLKATPSKSAEDISYKPDTRAAITHQRSRSALVERIDYNRSPNTLAKSTKSHSFNSDLSAKPAARIKKWISSPVPPRSRMTSVSDSIDTTNSVVNYMQTTPSHCDNHTTSNTNISPTNSVIVNQMDQSHNLKPLTSYLKVPSVSHLSSSNSSPSLSLVFDPESGRTSPSPSDQSSMYRRYSDEGRNDLVFPIKLRMSSGEEKEIYLTKQIYSNTKHSNTKTQGTSTTDPKPGASTNPDDHKARRLSPA